MIDETDEVIGLDELPGVLHVSKKTILNRIRANQEVPPHFRVGKKILFRKSALLKWIEEQERQAQQKAKSAAGGDGP